MTRQDENRSDQVTPGWGQRLRHAIFSTLRWSRLTVSLLVAWWFTFAPSVLAVWISSITGVGGFRQAWLIGFCLFVLAALFSPALQTVLAASRDRSEEAWMVFRSRPLMIRNGAGFRPDRGRVTYPTVVSVKSLHNAPFPDLSGGWSLWLRPIKNVAAPVMRSWLPSVSEAKIRMPNGTLTAEGDYHNVVTAVLTESFGYSYGVPSIDPDRKHMRLKMSRYPLNRNVEIGDPEQITANHIARVDREAAERDNRKETPALTTPVALGLDVIGSNGPGFVVLGEDIERHYFGLDISENAPTPHSLLTGPTSYGKTTLSYLFILHYLLHGGQVLIVDPKKIDFDQFAGLATIAQTEDEWMALLSWLLGPFTNERRAILQRHGVNHVNKIPAAERPHPVLLVIDEMSSFIGLAFEGDDDTQAVLAAAFIRIVKRLRYLGVRILAMDQDATGDVFGPSAQFGVKVKANLPSRFCVGTRGAKTLVHTFDNSEIIPQSVLSEAAQAIPGRTIHSLTERSNTSPDIGQAFYISEATIDRFIAERVDIPALPAVVDLAEPPPPEADGALVGPEESRRMIEQIESGVEIDEVLGDDLQFTEEDLALMETF